MGHHNGIAGLRRNLLGALSLALAGLAPAPAEAADGLALFESVIKAKLPAGALSYGSAAALGPSGFVLNDAVITPPADAKTGSKPMPIAIQTIAVEDLDFDHLAKDEPPEFARLHLDGISVPGDAITGFDLTKLGPVPLLGDLVLDYRAEPGREMFTLSRLELTLRGLGRLEVSLILDGVTPKDAGNPDGAKDKTSLRSATIVYDDASLLAKLMPLLVSDQKTSAADFVAGATILLEGLKKDQDANAQAALTTVIAFLGDWQHPKGPLRVTINPPTRTTGADFDKLTADKLGLVVSYAGASAAAPGKADLAAFCKPGTRLFVLSDDAWWAATAREPTQSRDRCVVRIENAPDDDVALPMERVTAWAIDGPGTAAAACAQGDRVLVLSDGAWYAARIKAQPGKDGLCPVHYDGYGNDEDEAVPLKRVRAFR